jgi:hypothetical protein
MYRLSRVKLNDYIFFFYIPFIDELLDEVCNIPIIILSLINDYVDIMCGYGQSNVICELYLFVLLIKFDSNC